MNILYYDPSKIKLPDDPLESDSDDMSGNEASNQESLGAVSNRQDHFISIGADSKYRKGHMIDIYVSIVSDLSHKIIIHVNEL
jgi:hypothetical protein